MPTKIIRDPTHIPALFRLLSERKMPLTVSWVQGASQKDAQNHLAQRWFTDIARQLGDTDREDIRAGCKVSFGVPILSEENEAFRIVWSRRFGGLGHEQVCEEVRVLDIPVTRLMTLKQMSDFMDQVARYWRGRGMYLTDPDALKYEMEFSPMEGAA